VTKQWPIISDICLLQLASISTVTNQSMLKLNNFEMNFIQM